MSSNSGPNTCRRSARSRNVSESSESSSWLSNDGRGNVGQPAKQFRCPTDAGSHTDNNSPERVKRKKRRKNVYGFSAEECKVMKRRVAELVKQNRLSDELLRLKLKDNRVPLVLLKRLEHERISQPKLADEACAQTKLKNETFNQKKLAEVSNQKKLVDVPGDVLQAQVQLSNEPSVQEKLAEETHVHVKPVVELPAETKLSDEPRTQKRPVGRPPKSKLSKEPPQSKFPKEPDQPKLLKESTQPKLVKESSQPKLVKEFPQSKLAIETPQPKLTKETPQPKLGSVTPQLKLAKETPQPKLGSETPQPKLAKETPQPKLGSVTPQLKLAKETPQPKLGSETPQPKLVKEISLPKLANETPQLKLPKEPPQSKLAKDSSLPKLTKDSSQPKLTKDSSQSKLAKEPSQPKLAEEKSTEEKSEEKKEEIQQECVQMTNVILPRKIDPSILKRRLVIRINKRQTDRLVAKKLSLQRRLLKELSAEKERIAPIAEPTPVNSGDSDKCAARLTEKSNDCLTDENKCTKNPIVSSGKKQLRIPIDKSNNDRLPEKLLEDNSRCMLNSLSLSEASAAENQSESSKSFLHSNRKNKRKTVDQINDKISVDLVEVEPKCIKDSVVKEDEKLSDNSSKDVKKYSKNSVKETEKVSQQIIVKSNKTKSDISGNSEEKRQLFSTKEIRERQTEAVQISKVIKKPFKIRTRPRRNLASKSDNAVDSSSDINEKVSTKLDKVIQHNIKCQAESDKVVKKNEAEKCDIQSTVEKTLDSTEKSVEKCSKSSESDENLKYSKDETDCNKVLEKSNNENKLHSEDVAENHVVENVIKCGDKLPEKLNKNVNKWIKNQTEKSIKSTRNIHSKTEKQADNAQENDSFSQSVVKEINEGQSNNLDIVIEKYNNDSKEPIENTKRNLEKSVTLVKESSENDSKSCIGKAKRISKKFVQNSVNDKTESLFNSNSEAVKDVCEKTVQIQTKNKNENLSKNFDEKIKKNIKVAIKQVKYQVTNVDTLCNEKHSKKAEKTENFVKNSVEKHNKKHTDAKEENQISLNLADVNQRPKRNLIKRNLEIYANTCTTSKAENDIDKHNERLPENLNKNDAIEVSKRKSRKLYNKEVHLENEIQLPIEKSNEKVPEMLNVNTADLKPESVTGKRSKRILALDKNVKSAETLISSDVDKKESLTKENEKQLTELQKMTESCEETEEQNSTTAVPALPQKLDKVSVNLIENVSNSVHNVIQKDVSKDLNEASSNTAVTVPKRRGRRRKSLPDANEKIISNIVKSASIPDDLQNQIEQSIMSNLNVLKNKVDKSEQSTVKTVKKCTRLQLTIEKRVTRNSVPEEKPVQIPTENKVDLINRKVDSDKSISDETKSNDNLHKTDLVIDHQAKSIENSETIVTKTVQSDVEKNDLPSNDTQKEVKEHIKIEIVNHKRITRKTLLNQEDMCIESASKVNSDDTEASTDESKKKIMRKSIRDDNKEKSDTLDNINTVPFDQETPIESSEEITAVSVKDNDVINGHLENTEATVTEAAQNDVEMSDQHNEDLQEAIKEISKSESTNQKRLTKKSSVNKRKDPIENTDTISKDFEDSTDKSMKRVTRKTITDKSKVTESLHEDKLLLDHPEKPIQDAEEIIKKLVQNETEINGFTEDSQKEIIENTKNQIVNEKRVTRKSSPNKHDKQIESIPAISEDKEGSADNKKRITRKTITEKSKVTESLHEDKLLLDHPEKPIQDTEEIIKKVVQNETEINGFTEDSQKEIIENTKSQILNEKRVTRKSSPNKHEKQIESTPAISEGKEGSADNKKRTTRKTITDKSKVTESLREDKFIFNRPEKPIQDAVEIITKKVQIEVEVNGFTEDSQKEIIENTKNQIVNQKRVTRKSSPNKHEKQIESTPAISEDKEGSADIKKRVTRKSILDKSKVTESLHEDKLLLDHSEKPIQDTEAIIKEAVQNEIEINGFTEDSQKEIIENTNSQLTNQKRVTRKSSPNKHEKKIEISTSAASEDIEASIDECKNKSGSGRRTTRKEKLEKYAESVSSNDDKIVEEPQKINKECPKSEKVARKVSPDKFDKQTENLIINNLETVINSIDEEDKILSETLDNKENTKTQIEVNARVTRNSSLKKDRHTKNLIENNMDCVHNEDNKDKSLENVVSTVKVFSKNLTDNKKFRKTSVDKVNDIQTENLVDNNSASLHNLIEESEQKQFEGSLKRRSKEFSESVKRKSAQNDSELNSANVQSSLEEKQFSTTDDKKSTIVVENNRRVTRKSAEMHSEAIAKDSAKLTDHNLLPEASEKSIAVCEESDKDSLKIDQSDISKSPAKAKGLVNSIKSFNEHNDTCTEILQVSIDVNNESQPNNNKLICSESLTQKSTEDTKTTVAVEVATDSTENSKRTLECSAASLETSSPDQQTTVNNKSVSVSEEQPVKCSKRISLRAFRKVKENKPAPISDSNSVTTIELTTKEENRVESLNKNIVHAVVESNRDNKDVVTELSTDNLSNDATEESAKFDVQKADDSINISSPNLNVNEKCTINSSQESNENPLENTCESANATIAETITDKLDDIVEKLQDAQETAANDTALIENKENVNEDSSCNQESNETESENSFKSALDVMVSKEIETLTEISNPVEEHDVNDLNNLEIPQLESLCSAEPFPANTVEEPLEDALDNLELPSSESLNNLELPTFESPNLDSAIETTLEDVGSSSETCSKMLETSIEKTPENEENSAKKRRLATLLELKRKCTENLDKKQAADYQNQLKEAIDTLIASGSLDSIDPSSDSCLGNEATENEENFESLSDEFDDENLASRLANLNDLKIPPLETEKDSTAGFGKENEKEKPTPKLNKSFLEMNAMTCTYCDTCFTSNRELKKHVKLQHRQRLVIKITKTDSNEHKTQLVESTEKSVPEQQPPLVADVDSIPPNERFPMVAEEEPITDGEIKIIVKKESGSKNSHVVKEIKITPKSSDGGSSVRIPGFSPALSDASAGGSSVNSPALEMPGLAAVKKPRGRPRKYPIFTENEILAKEMAAQVLVQEQERMKRQQLCDNTPIFEPVESIIPPYEDRVKAKPVEPLPELPKERVKRKRKVRVFDEDTEEEEPPEPVRVKKRRGRPPRKKPEQLLQELNERLQQAQAQQSANPQQVKETPELQQAQESQQVQQLPKSQQVQVHEQKLPNSAAEPVKEQLALPELPKSQVSQVPPKPQQHPQAVAQSQTVPQPLQRPIPPLVPSSMPIRITSSLPLPLLTPTLTPTLRPTAIPPLKQTPVPPLTSTAIPPLRPTQIPPLRQTPVPFLIPNLTPTMSMPSLAPLSTSPAPSPAPVPAAPEGPDSDEKRRKLVESLQEFIVIGPEEKKRKLEGASGQEEAEDQAAAPESPDATDVSKPEKGLLTRKFGMTKELVVRLTKIDTVPKDCEDFNGDVDDSERIDGDPKVSSDERLRRKLKPKLANEEGEESSRESLSSVVRMNLRRKLENNNNHVNDVQKCLPATSSPRRTLSSDGQALEAATSDAAKKQSDVVVQQEATNNQAVVTPRRQTMDKAEADESQKAKLMMLMNATTPNEATNKAASNSVTEAPRAQPQSQPQIQMQLQQQPQNQLQVQQQSQPLPLPLPQMQHQVHPQSQPPPQVQQPIQTQPQTVLQLQQPQQFCILFIPDYDGNGPRDVAPTATIVNFQPVPDNEIHNKPLIYMPTTPTKISVDDHAKAYVCANCTKVLDLIGRLEANVGMTEEDKSAITCPYCSNHFQSLFYLEYHVMHEHLKCENEKQCRHSRVNSLRIPTHEVATEFESYITFALKCRSCYDIFDSVLALNDHVMYKHKTLVRLKPSSPAASGSNAYPAPFVGKNGAIGAVLQCPSDCVCRIGIRSTDTPLQRQQMLKRCPNAMRRLEKIEPAAYEVYTCTLCKSTFLMKDEVIDHLMKMHEVSCKFPCYTCLTSFRSLQIQENHQCSETTLQDFDKLLNIAILPTNVGGKEHNNKFLEREDSSTDEYGAMKTTSPRAQSASTATASVPVKNGMKRKNGATIAALSQLLSKKPKLTNTVPQPALPNKRKRKRACPKCKKRFAYRKSLHDHVIYEHIMKGESADGPKKTAVELLMLLSNNRANYKRIEELAEMLNGYTDEDGVSLRKLAMMEDYEQENEEEEESSSQSANKEPRIGADVAQCIRCKMRFSIATSGNAGQPSTQDEEQRKPLLCDNCEGITGPKTRRRGTVSNGQLSDDESSDSQSAPSQMLTFSCKKCSETFPNIVELKTHKRTVHGKQGVEHLYSCDICTKSFAAPRMLEKHKKIHRESVLDESAKPEEDEANRSSSQNSGDNSKDSEANDSLNDKVNSSNRRDSSDSSGAGSKEPEEQLLDCSFCEEVCSSKVSLKNHLKREHGRRASICQFCNGLLIDTSEVRHMLDYHIVPSKTSTRQTIVRNNGNILHCGDSCMQEDIDELIRTLGKHRLQSLMVYHDFEGKCNNAIMRCPICPELFATRESCRFHYVWIHDDNCLLCDETFRSGSSACQHKVDAHTSTASYLWCIQRLVTAIVNTLNLDPDQPSHVLYEVLAMRLDDEEEEARIASESTVGDTAEKGTNEEAPSATERFLEEVLSEDQLPDSGNMIEVVIGREDSEDDLLSMLNLSPNYETTCEQLPNASAAPPEEEEEEEVPPAPTSPTMAASSVNVPVPTTPTAAASSSLATTVSSPVASSPTTVTNASPVLGNYCASGVYLCKHSDGDEQFVLVVAGEDEITYKNDIGSLAVRISETCEVFTLEEITEMLRVHFANLNQNSDGGA